MNKIKELHNKSMDLAERAFIARANGNENESVSLSEKALKSELAAISELEKTGRVEPTYSVLCRSAGTLALDCHQIREAEKIVAKALSREPPPEIADELRELLEQINVRRHLISWEDAKPQHAINQAPQAENRQLPGQ